MSNVLRLLVASGARKPGLRMDRSTGWKRVQCCVREPARAPSRCTRRLPEAGVPGLPALAPMKIEAARDRVDRRATVHCDVDGAAIWRQVHLNSRNERASGTAEDANWT